MRFFIVAAIFFSGYANALHSDGCNPNDGACMAHLNQDISDSNDQATLIMVGLVGGTVYYFMNRRISELEDKEKNDFLQEINSTGRIPILKKNNFEISVPVVSKRNSRFKISNNFESYKQLNSFNSETSILEIRLNF